MWERKSDDKNQTFYRFPFPVMNLFNGSYEKTWNFLRSQTKHLHFNQNICSFFPLGSLCSRRPDSEKKKKKNLEFKTKDVGIHPLITDQEGENAPPQRRTGWLWGAWPEEEGRSPSASPPRGNGRSRPEPGKHQWEKSQSGGRSFCFCLNMSGLKIQHSLIRAFYLKSLFSLK